MKLEVDRLNGFEFSQTIAGQHGGKTNKRIDVICDIRAGVISSIFAVFDHKKEVVRTNSLESAVDFFNDIK